MYGFKECSSCGALYNREQCCSNVSSVDNFVRDPNPISYDETPDSSQQTLRNCSKCGGPFGGLYCRQCTCERCRRNYTDEVCALCCYEVEKSFVNDSNSNSFIDSPNIFYPPSQPQTSSLDQWHCFHCKDPLERGKRCKRSSCKWCGSGLSEGFCFIYASNNKIHLLRNAWKTESDKLIKSSVENLVPIPSESEDFSDNESKCDVPVFDDFTTFSNPLFDSDDDFSSNDDNSISDEDIEPHHFNVESDLIESLLNRDISTVSYPKIDSLLEEFSGELAHIDLIPPGINKADFDPEEEIRLIEELLYDNSSPRPPKESNSEISDATIESSSPSPIPVEDSDSLMEEIDLFLDLDDSIPPGIESDDYDSKGDILFLEELLSNDSFSLAETESFHFDLYDVPSSPRPPAKPPDDGIFFDFEPDTGVLTAKVVEDISEHYVLMPKLLLTQPTLCPDIDTLLPFSSENEDKVFNPGILSSPLLSHRGKIISDFSESPMMISGGNIPLLDVPYGDRVRLKTRVTKISASIAPDYEDSRARGFVHRPLDLQSFACLYMGI
ncbi:hypothetical protein Tco_0686582 [Tanacetum coccineum]